MEVRMFKESRKKTNKKSIDILYSYHNSSIALEAGKSWETARHVEVDAVHGPFCLLCSGRQGGLEMLLPVDVMFSPSTGFH